MTIPWLKANNSQGHFFLNDRQSIYSIQILSPNHIGIINVSQNCIIDRLQCVDIDKIPDLKKKSICSIQFYLNIRNLMFPFQIFINSNAKIFKRICGIGSFSTKFNFNFTVYLLSLVFKNYQLSFLHI